MWDPFFGVAENSLLHKKALDRYEMSINTQSGMCQGKVEQGYPEKALAISEK